MKAKEVLSGKKEAAEAKKVTGTGTRVSGYVDDPTPKRCNTCEYFKSPGLCKNARVLKDKEVKTDKKSGLKIVDPVNGCCSFWEPEDEQD